MILEIAGKKFDNSKDALNFVKANKSLIISAKKAEVKTKANVLGFYNSKTGAVKDSIPKNSDYIYPVISTTNYMDTHLDVHFKGSMTKTAKEQNHKVYYVADHELKVDNIIAAPQDVEIQLLSLPWSELGKNFEGEAEAFVFKIHKDKIRHDKFKQLIADGVPLENSIRMQYIKLGIGVNDVDDKEGFAYWNKNIEKIANKEFAESVGFFFGVEELKIVMEGSAVLFGSNNATPTKNEAVSDTSTEPFDKNTQKRKMELYNEIINQLN